MFVCGTALIEIRCHCDDVRALPEFGNLDAFLLVPLEVRNESVPYVHVVSGITYRYRELEGVQERWQRLQRALAECFDKSLANASFE